MTCAANSVSVKADQWEVGEHLARVEIRELLSVLCDFTGGFAVSGDVQRIHSHVLIRFGKENR
jgi:hypothetical protein